MLWFGLAEQNPGAPPPPASKPPAGPPPAPSIEPQDDEGSDPNELMLKLLPWAISILLHAGIILLAAFIVWSVDKKVDEEETIVPIARLSATPGAPLTMQQSKTLSKTSRSQTRRSLTSRTQNTQSTSQLSSKVNMQSLTIGAAGGAAGSASPFSTGIKAEGEFKATMYGTGGNARRLAYLIDASGSLIDTLDFVILELKRSITELSDKQQFTVIFFQGEEAIEVPPRGLKKASPEIKRQVITWIDRDAGNITPMGLSNPVKALQLALKYQPQLLFILSDNITGQGRYEVDQRRLLAEIESANKQGTKINTIQFLYPDPLTRVGMKGTLELISERSGGEFKYLDAGELGIQ
jgi:hypothetical protein